MSSEAKDPIVKSDKVNNTKENPKAAKQDQPSLKPAALLPAEVQPNDIVFGRGKGYHGHHGNERMREIIDKYKMQYHAIDRSQKRDLVEVVYDEIMQDGARFLVKAPSGYVEADRTMSLQKVSNALRCKKSFQREAAISAAVAGQSAKGKGAKFPPENDSVARALASRPLHESLSSPVAGAGRGLTSLESLILANNQANNNLYAASQLVPLNLASQPLRSDMLPRSAAMGAGAPALSAAMGAGAPSLSAALRSELAASLEHEAAQRNLAMGIRTPSSLPYAAITGQQGLDNISLLRQELLLHQLGLGGPRLQAGSMANDLSNRLIMEELFSPSRAMHRNSLDGNASDKKNPPRKDSGL